MKILGTYLNFSLINQLGSNKDKVSKLFQHVYAYELLLQRPCEVKGHAENPRHLELCTLAKVETRYQFISKTLKLT